MQRDVLVLAKTVAANDFPVERPAVIGVDRENGALLRLTPFPWARGDSDPPIARWSWIQAGLLPAARDPRPESREVEGEIVGSGYVDAKEGWRLRWPFVRPHLFGSLEALQRAAREGRSTVGFVTPAPEADVLQLPLRLRFRCASDECTAAHELPVLDWELHEMARLSRERFGARWATRFRESWGAPHFARYDVRVLLSAYAQAQGRFHVAALFSPPRQAEDPHEHAHHAQHAAHKREGAA